MAKSILVIDGDYEATRTISTALETEGYFVYAASSADVALTMAKRVRPALIILNLMVKGAGGLEFINRLRSLEQARNMPILMLMEGEKEYDPRYREKYGIVNFILKPVDIFELVSKCKASVEDIPEHEEVFSPAPARPVSLPGQAADNTGGLEKNPAAEAETAGEAKNPGLAENGPPDEDGNLRGEESGGKNITEVFPPAGETAVLSGEESEEMPERDGEEQSGLRQSFFYGKKKKSGGKKVAAIAGLLFLGVAAAFGVFMFMSHGRGNTANNETIQAKDVENAPVIVQDTPPPVSNQPAADVQAQGTAPAQPAPVQPAGQPVSAPEQPVSAMKQAAAAPAGPAPALSAPKAPPPQKTVASKGEEARPVKKNGQAGHLAKASSRHGKFSSVQVGIFSAKGNAEKLVKKLKARGVKAFTEAAKKNGKTEYRVLAGKFSKPEEARVLAIKLRKLGYSAFFYKE
ncbi:MAG: SPOR domain-containing protein [Nitrospiraceae bacterium]|nr:SPOR domain-containing protein [Nitrospiraceae bacterium]